MPSNKMSENYFCGFCLVDYPISFIKQAKWSLNVTAFKEVYATKKSINSNLPFGWDDVRDLSDVYLKCNLHQIN